MGGFRRIGGLVALGLMSGCAASIEADSAPFAPVASAVAGIDILHQAVEVSPFAEADGLTGEQAMAFQTKTGGDRLRFLGGPLEIDALTLDGDPLADWSTTDGGIEVRLGRTLEPGSRHSLHLTYRAGAGRGFKRTDDLAYSTYFACDWMLCSQADFSDRFTIDLAIRTPPGMRTLGPGTEVEVTPLAAAMELHRWRTTEAYPAYVHGFVAGRLEQHDVSGDCATRLDVLTTAPADGVRAIFGPTCAMLTYFEERSGVPYPAGRYSQLYVPGVSEAQEAISHSTLGGGAVEPMIADPKEDWAVAHELAHQWWGNRITAADLSQFWLNEGIVTFMTASWKAHRWGEAAYDHEIELARTRWTRCREEGQDAPLAFAGPWPSLATRRCIQYSKGAVFLDTLKRSMGDEAFWRGLRAFTTGHLGQSVRSGDFEAAMQSATQDDLRPLFAEWVDAGPR